MGPGVVVVLILVIGTALVLAAMFADRRSAVGASGSAQSPPRPTTPSPTDDTEPPTYLTSSHLLAQAPPAARLSPDQERELAAQLADASTTRVDCHLAAQALATHTGFRAILDQPVVLVCSDPVGGFRELMALLAGAAADRLPIVVAAPAIDADTLQTLVANKLAGKVDVAVVLGAEAELARLADVCGSPLTGLSERQAGAVSVRTLGRPGRVVAHERSTWVMPPIPS